MLAIKLDVVHGTVTLFKLLTFTRLLWCFMVRFTESNPLCPDTALLLSLLIFKQQDQCFSIGSQKWVPCNPVVGQDGYENISHLSGALNFGNLNKMLSGLEKRWMGNSVNNITLYVATTDKSEPFTCVSSYQRVFLYWVNQGLFTFIHVFCTKPQHTPKPDNRNTGLAGHTLYSRTAKVTGKSYLHIKQRLSGGWTHLTCDSTVFLFVK